MESRQKFIRNRRLISVLCFIFLLVSACGDRTLTIKKTDSVVTKLTAAEQRLQWKNKLGWSDPRCMSYETFEENTGIEQYPLDKRISLVVVTCSLGTYQGDSLLYLLKKGKKAQLLKFQQFQSLDIGELDPYKDTLLTGIVQLEPKGKASLIKVWRKYRGIGDCGQLLRYSIESGQARLIELRVKNCEDEIKHVPPEQWPEVKLSVTQ